MSERRSQQRFLDAELVMLAWDVDRTKLMELGNVEDLSLNGMGVIVSNAIQVGTAVSITYGDRDFTGIVRHQSRREEGHFIGIEFDLTSRDTTLHFDPELLVRCS
jgi:PilZ domain-containing protein